MPRDDLSIDWNRKNMPPVEHQDAAAVLDDFVNRVANLPAEIQFMQEEIADKDRQIQICLDAINTRDASIQKWIRINSSRVANPKEDHLRKIIIENYDKVQLLQEEKCALALKSQRAIDRHVRYMDGHIKALQDRGDFPTDPDIPSLLRVPQPDQNAPRASEKKISLPIPQVNVPSTNSHNNLPRHVGQQNGIQRMLPGQPQAQPPSSSMMPSGPASPAALILSRQQREGSTGAASKRQRLTGGISTTPANSSGLARHPSTGPSTPKAGTPTAVRAGSAGPRATLKSVAGKKIAPHKQGGVLRKGKPGKSGLSRVKRGPGNRNSPSSTNDSELSDAESGTADEEDEATTPPSTGRKRVEDEAGNGDDDEGSDDKKYCTCQSVSHGDMVACDNDDCPYEWFHWNCVGLTREPVGSWYCPVCKPKEMERRRKERELLGV